MNDKRQHVGSDKWPLDTGWKHNKGKHDVGVVLF